MKRILVNCWNKSFDIYLWIKDRLYIIKDKVYQQITQPPYIVSINDTIQYILDNRCSVSRLGDGEIKIVAGKVLGFQTYSPVLQNRMIQILSNPIPNHIVCLPDIFKDINIYKEEPYKHWKLHLAYYRPIWYKYINKNRIYYNAFMSRCYMMFKDQSLTEHYFQLIKQLWHHKKVLLIEGEKSRLGVGNDLFDNVTSIKRILAPNRNAFNHYEAILQEVLKYEASDYLVLLALGPTATILAYDLALKGYQAIDIGHMDIEYEWFKMGATHKVPVPNKFVNEAGAGAGVGDINNETYKSQIVCQF